MAATPQRDSLSEDGQTRSPINPESILAEWTYEIKGSKTKRTITIRIGFPTALENGYFECKSEIADGRVRIMRPRCGVDAFEAVLLALYNIGIELTILTGVKTDHFTWLDGKQAGLRFPTMPNFTLKSIHD